MCCPGGGGCHTGVEDVVVRAEDYVGRVGQRAAPKVCARCAQEVDPAGVWGGARRYIQGIMSTHWLKSTDMSLNTVLGGPEFVHVTNSKATAPMH